MPANALTLHPMRVFDLKRRLGWGIAAAALLLGLLASAYSLAQARQRIAGDMQRLGATLGQLTLKELRFTPGVFQSQLRPVDLEAFAGIGQLLPFCLQVEDIHAQALSQRCFGPGDGAPAGVAEVLGWALRDLPVLRIRLNRYPGIKVGEMLLSPHVAAEAAALWQQWRLVLAMAGAVLALGAVVHGTVRRALRPSAAMLATIARMEAGDLSARMPALGLLEFERIGRTFNQLAERLQNTLADQRALADRLLSVREEERRHLSRELHDEFGQSLASISAEAAYAGEVAQESLPALLPCTESIARSTAGLMASLQGMVQRLRPLALEAFGLEASLRQIVEGWQRRDAGRCQYRLRVSGALDALPEALAIHLYRLVQEALTNAIRHGQATAIEVSLEAVPGEQVRLCVSDDGQATRLPEPRPAGQGLLGMRERVLALGGTLTLALHAPHGLQVEVVLPLTEGGA